MKGFLVFLLIILFLAMLGGFQSGDDQIDYSDSDPEVMKAWEEVYIGINPYEVAQDSLEMTTQDSLQGDSLSQMDAKCTL